MKTFSEYLQLVKTKILANLSSAKRQLKQEVHQPANWIMIIILLLAAAVRFYKLPYMAQYDFDQEYVTNFALDVLRIYPIRLIGQGMSIQGIFMGPWYFYYLVPFYWLAGGHPIGGVMGSVLLGLLIIISYYIVGSALFNRKVGLLAAFIRGISSWAVTADWAMVPSYSSDLLVIWVLYLQYRLWSSGKKTAIWALPLLSLLLGMFTSIHPIALPLILVSIIVLLWRWRSIKPPQWLIPLSLMLFVLPSIPLIYFDWLRNWSMVRQILGMLGFSSLAATNDIALSSESSLLDHSFNDIVSKMIIMMAVTRNFFNDLVQLPKNLAPWGVPLMLLMAIIAERFAATKNKIARNFHRLIMPTTWIVFVLYYTFFPTHVPEYYLGAVRALLMLYVAAALVGWWNISNQLSKLFLSSPSKEKHTKLSSPVKKQQLFISEIIDWSGKLLVILVLIWISFGHGEKLNKLYQRGLTISLADKDAIVQELIKQTGGQPYRLSMVTALGWGFGYDSLLRVYEHSPHESGPVYTIVSPLNEIEAQHEIDFTSGNIGLIFPDEEIEN